MEAGRLYKAISDSGSPGHYRPRCFVDNISALDGGEKYASAEFKHDAFENIKVMRKNCVLTDVTLEAGKEIFHAHKLILAAASPYFKVMFTGGLRETDQETIKIHDVCPTVFSHILCFMYSGEIVIDEKLVCQILPAAAMFQVSKEEEFLQLSSSQLLDLIQRDELYVPDEKDVYNAVLRWVAHNEESRQPQMQQILQAVRCQYLTPRFLKEQMSHCKLLKKVPACREYLAKIFKDLTLHKPPCQRERTPKAPNIIYVIGGYSRRQSLDTLERYDIGKNTWQQLARIPAARSGLAAAFLRGKIYALGGRNILPNGNYHDSNWVDAYDPSTDHWHQKALMHFARNRLGVAVLDGQLYAAGGSDGDVFHNSVEKYDPEEDSWNLVTSMSESRMGAGIVVVNRLMYAVGGFDGTNRLSSVECYHPENNKWTYVTPMKVQRSGVGVCAMGRFIYVIGGYNGHRQLNTVERYDTESDTWISLSCLLTARSAMTVCVSEEKIFVMGGYDGREFLSSVEVYCPEANHWSEGRALPKGRSGHASACSSHLPGSAT